MVQTKKIDKATMRRNIAVMLMMAGNDPEVEDLIRKLAKLCFEYRDGRLYVGSEYPPKWEVRKSKTGGLWCKCPNSAFQARKNGGLCKHAMFATVAEIEVPATGIDV
jgi:hypothetical protein